MQYSYAQRLSLTGFLNSLLNEWHGYEKRDNEIVISRAGGDLVLPLLRDSLVQRFSFAWPALMRVQGQETVLSYQNVVEFICQSPEIIGDYSIEQIEQFKTQVFASQEHIQDVISKRTQDININGFIGAEQSLIGGHNLHPASKAHQGWTPQESQIFSPDYAGEFALHWYFVKSELIDGESADAENDGKIDSLTALLLQSYQDAGIKQIIPIGFVPYPVHPHQAKILRGNNSMQQYFSDGSIVELNEQGRPWRATSSTRALWQQDSRWMLKFSLAVKLTNSIRHLSPTELSRGVLFKHLSNELAGAEFNQRFPHFNVLQEPAWCGLQSLDGGVILDSLFCWRENPYLTGTEPTVTLATMTQENEQGSNAIAELVNKIAVNRDISIANASFIWFEHFLENVIKPVAVARGDYGIVMLAHQQNLLVTLENSLPVGGAFRDCQGTGYTETALIRFKLLAANKPAYFADSETVNPYFSYYLILNSLNSVIAALSTQLSTVESDSLLHISQNLWHQLEQHSFYDSSFYRYLLETESLKIKGNFFCFLGIKNETDLKDPSQIYADTANPYQLSVQDKNRVTYKPVLFDRDDPVEKQTGLNLIFIQKPTVLTVQSSWQQWHLQWHVDNEGGHHLSSSDLVNSEKVVNTRLKLETKMSPKQWFNVIEYFFSGLVSPTEEVKQPVAEQVLISEQTWWQTTYTPIPDWAEIISGQIMIKRGDFFQLSCIWNAPKAILKAPIIIEADNGNSHPLRPEQPKGTFFQRYIYPLQRVISFRCADVEADVAIFSDWQNTPNIARMWEMAGDIDSHRNYLNKQTNAAHSMPVIGYFDGVPFGYFEVYWTPEDRLGPYYECHAYDRGVHMLVGNKLFLGHKNFINWSKAILHAVFMDEQSTLNIMGEPRADNHHVIRITKNIGMKKLKEFDFPHKRSALMCCDRSEFFNSYI